MRGPPTPSRLVGQTMAGVLVLATAACAQPGIGGGPSRPTAEEYEVFGAVVHEVFTGPFQNVRGPRRTAIPEGTYVLVPRERLLPWLMMDSALAEVDEVPPSAWAHYMAANEEPFVLEPRVPGLARQVTPHRDDLNATFADGGWDAFYAHYPDAVALVGLSRVGFSADGNAAVVFVSRYHGGLNGEFGIVHLRRETDGWTVVGWPLGKGISG